MPATTGQKKLVSKLAYSLPRIRLALVRESNKNRQRYAISSPKDAAQFLEPLRHAPEEHFVSLHLNAKNEVIGLHEVSHGTLSASLVHPREVFKAAVIGNCFSILVCHNHPSGAVLSPSKEDLDTTRQLLKAGKILGVSLMDHLIIGGDDESMAVYSIRENHPRIWEDPFSQLS